MADRADVRILPPIVLLLALALGGALAASLPVRLLPSGIALVAGAGLIFVSIFLVLTAVRELRRAKTAFDVRKPTRTVVTGGVFGVTRNPVYLSMMALYVGIALWVNSPWMLLIAIPLGSALCLTAIRSEERYLTAKFGDDYGRYAARVPRWLSWRSLARRPSL